MIKEIKNENKELFNAMPFEYRKIAADACIFNQIRELERIKTVCETRIKQLKDWVVSEHKHKS